MCDSWVWSTYGGPIHLFRSTADDDSVSPAGITPCKLNSGPHVADVMYGLLVPNVGSAKADTCCVIPVTVDESTELCEIPGSVSTMVDLHLFRITADDDSVSPAGITPCELNSGPHMAAKARTVHGSVAKESRENKSDHVLVPKLEPVSRVSKRISYSRSKRCRGRWKNGTANEGLVAIIS